MNTIPEHNALQEVSIALNEVCYRKFRSWSVKVDTERSDR